MVATTKYNTW